MLAGVLVLCCLVLLVGETRRAAGPVRPDRVGRRAAATPIRLGRAGCRTAADAALLAPWACRC